MKKVNKKLLLVGIFVFSLVVSHIILVIQVITLNNSIIVLEKRTVSFEKKLESYKADNNKQIINIQKELELMNKKTDAQFSETVGMSKTYNRILKEQKNKTIDTAEKDNGFIMAKKKAFELYKKGKYSEAYDEVKRIIQSNSDDIECRQYKVKSLYYKNRADSSSYSEILEDINILKQNGDVDEEINEIEKAIIAEKEGVL